jgi:Nucleotidyl transferase AbiEii toxin, Type IV TA system
VTPNVAQSIHDRLLNRAKRTGDEFQSVLTRYALERFLYRLSLTDDGNRFLLKGALLFDLWFSEPHRPTRDADLLGFGPMDSEVLATIIKDACGRENADGVTFDPNTVRIEEIREQARYGGLRVKLAGLLGNSRLHVQLDVGYGDAVTPGPEDIELPTLLKDLPAPRLRAYPRATVVAEKFEALVSLGMANSRLKDYFDLRALGHEGALENETLAEAIRATFARRGTPLPIELPLGLSDEFVAAKQTQWNAFLRKNRLNAPDLGQVVIDLRMFLLPVLKMATKTGIAM